MTTPRPSLLAALALASLLPISAFAENSAPKPAEKVAPAEKAGTTEKAAPKTAKLAVGEPMPALTPEVWVQGEPVLAFEDGKTYLIECWATWCGPCVQIIPHVNALHNKFKDEGFTVIGLNVWESAGLDNVRAFVKERGDGMAYRVAYDGKTGNGAALLKAAGVNGIPHAIVVRDGKVLWHGHPASLKEELVKSMIDGKFDGEKVAREEAAAYERREKLQNAVRKAMSLQSEKKFDEALAILDPLIKETTGDDLPMLKYYRAAILIGQGAPGTTPRLIELAGEYPDNAAIQYLVGASLLGAESLKDQRDPKAAKIITARLLAKENNPFLQLLNARADYEVGDKEAAEKALAEIAAKTTREGNNRRGKPAHELAQLALDAVKEGKPWPAEANLVR